MGRRNHHQQLRLVFSVVIIIGSVLYGVLISYDSELARSIMLGYIGAVLTCFALFECWRPHD